MRKTDNRRKKVQMPAGIRQKMMAAVSMLLVSSIMMVSSTYAWFTLSTAPEVTGITTNVGANGNLEMMLLNGQLGEDGNENGSFYSDQDDLGVVSKVGDSIAATEDAKISNEKWGNLVDLSDEYYGLNNIVLSPARLNVESVSDTAKSVGLTMLNAPTYGTDGRVVDVKTATYGGKATGNTFTYDEAHRGVRILGTTTDVSQRLAAYRSAKAAVTTNIKAAKNTATTSLVANGQSLANILVGYAADQTKKFSDVDLQVFKRVFDSLNDANENAADAIRSAVLAYSLSADNTNAEFADDAAVTALATLINGTEITSVNSFTGTNVLIPSGTDVAVTTYLGIKDKVSEAEAALVALNPDYETSSDTTGKYGYEQISGILNMIVNKKYVEIAGQTDLGSDDIQAVIDEYVANSKITMTMLNGSGVYADLATMVGNYTVSGLTVHVTYGKFDVDVPIIMQTNVTGSGIPQIENIVIGTTPEDDKSASTNIALSNTYGYAIDFGFRTNAAGSNLQLQTEAVNRVYSEQKDDTLNTQGSGSFMQFTSSDINNFSQAEVLALMSAIRVAFVSPTETGGDILAVAALDITSQTNQDGTTTYTPGGSVTAVGTNGYRAGLYLHDYTITEAGGVLTLGAIKADKSAITALTQNKASKITVIVYLDGDIVDNTMVANANTSMTGVMNIQFSSSAALAPMENTGMRAGGTSDAETKYTVEAAAGTEYTYEGVTGVVNPGYTIYKGVTGEGDNAKTAYYFSGDGGNTYTKLSATNFSAAITLKK